MRCEVPKEKRAEFEPGSGLPQEDCAGEVSRRNANHNEPERLKRHRINVGEVAASSTPAILHTLLGSCVAVCLFDPHTRAGGINHIWIPRARPGETGARYGVHAMEILINQLMHLGCDRRRFVAKAFGGAELFPASTICSVGASNIQFVREFLATEKIPLVAERLGGDRPVHLYFYAHINRARLRIVEQTRLHYSHLLARLHTSEPENLHQGEVTLFE